MDTNFQPSVQYSTILDIFVGERPPPSKYGQAKLYAQWEILIDDVDITEHDLPRQNGETEGTCNKENMHMECVKFLIT